MRELGPSSLLLLMLVPLIPPVFSGILRAAFADDFVLQWPLLKIPLDVGLIIGGLGSLAGMVWLVAGASIRIRDRRAVFGSLALLAVGAALAWRCLFNPWFDGLVSVGGGDTGQHLVMRQYFIDWPHVPKGSATFYAVTYWAERVFGLDAFGSFRLGFYVAVAVVLIVLAAVAARTGANATLRPWTALLVLWVLVSQVILFPLLHYMQGNGFFNQLFALLPLVAGWAVYGLADGARTRIVLLLVWVAVTRYTYALNLGDVFATVAILGGSEALALHPGRGRKLALAASVGCLVASVVAEVQLIRVWDEVAGVVPPFMILLIAGEALLAVGLGALPGLADWAGLSVGPAERRLARFASVIGCANLVPLLLHLLTGRSFQYFLLKYSFDVVALLATATVVLVPFTVPGIFRQALVRRSGHAKRRAIAIAAAIPVALLLLAGAYQPYLKTYVERVRGEPPWKRIGPVTDREGMRRISASLREERQPFAGLLGASWPLMHFMNAALGLGENSLSTTRNWEELAGLAILPLPGCLFWYSGPDELAQLAARREPGAAQVRARLCQLDALPDKRCQTYRAAWDPSRTLQLCHWCRSGGTSAVQAVPSGTTAEPCATQASRR